MAKLQLAQQQLCFFNGWRCCWRGACSSCSHVQLL
jgi:hypothetical protein